MLSRRDGGCTTSLAGNEVVFCWVLRPFFHPAESSGTTLILRWVWTLMASADARNRSLFLGLLNSTTSGRGFLNTVSSTFLHLPRRRVRFIPVLPGKPANLKKVVRW